MPSRPSLADAVAASATAAFANAAAGASPATAACDTAAASVATIVMDAPSVVDVVRGLLVMCLPFSQAPLIRQVFTSSCS
eukprot:354580-Chlamydomonas_euryale.AAC.3